MKKKFYQRYVIKSKEEAFVVLKSFIEGNYPNGASGYMDEAIGNIFTSEGSLGRDKVDTSWCFLVKDGELSETLYNWGNCDNIDEVAEKEGFGSLKEDNIVKDLYNEIVGPKNIFSLYKQDEEVFGLDASWYKKDTLFKKFEELAK